MTGLLTAAELARMLGVSPGWLRRHRAGLDAVGLPAPRLSSHDARGRTRSYWAATDVAGWMDSRTATEFAAATTADLDAATARLARRFGDAQT